MPNPSKRVNSWHLAEQYIHQYCQDPNLSEAVVAKKIGLCASYFSKAYQQVTGRKFRDVLNQTRVGLAQKLLIDTQVNIKDIAQKTGFRYHSSFTRSFRKFVGETPANYRRGSAIF